MALITSGLFGSRVQLVLTIDFPIRRPRAAARHDGVSVGRRGDLLHQGEVPARAGHPPAALCPQCLSRPFARSRRIKLTPGFARSLCDLLGKSAVVLVANESTGKEKELEKALEGRVVRFKPE